MKFFIIGPTGSIGQALVPVLTARGHEVVGLTRSQTTADSLVGLGGRPVRGDVTQSNTWQGEAAQADALINLISFPAQRGNLKWAKAFGALNETACRGLLAAAQQGGKCRSFIVPSGVYVVGDHGNDWIDEDTSPRPHPMLNAWGPNEQFVAMARRHEIPAVALRFGSIYAPTPTGTFGRTFLAAIAKGQFRYPGNGESYFPLVSMPDAVAAIVQAAEQSISAPYLYVVDDEPMRIKEVVTLLAAAFGQPAKSMPAWLFSLLAGKALASAIVGSFRVRNTHAKRMLDWRPLHPVFRDQVNSLVADYKSEIALSKEL